MAQRRQLEMFAKGRIVGMLESGRSQTEVSRILNVNQSVISRLWQRFQRTGDSVTRRPVSGRPRVTTPRQDRYLVISARRQRGSTAIALGSALTVATGIRISRQTVYRRLNHAGLYVRRPTVCISLTSAQKRARLNWSLKHQHWSVGEWANVMFSDESRFSLMSTDARRVTIWRERGTRFEPRNISESHHFLSRGVMVCAGLFEVQGLPGGISTLTTLKTSQAVLSVPDDILQSVIESVVYSMQRVIHKKDGHIVNGLCPC
ncbi:Transposable element Tcb2 transposase, partial [Stegodyphus mimosarum]